MMAHKKNGGQNKSKNFKQEKKVNIKRNEKWEREAQKEYNAKMEEKIALENAYWAPKDKEDEKFHMKMEQKMQDTGPSNKEIN